MRFFVCGECGGSSSSTTSASDPTQSSKYPTLSTATALKLLGVAPDGTTQSFLSTDELPAIVMLNADGVAFATNAPELSLPDATSEAFTRILVATSDDPAKWQMFNAPPGGSYFFGSTDGNWVPMAASTLPGFTELGVSGTTTSPLILMGLKDEGGGVFSANKLTAVSQRVIVGNADGLSFKTLPEGEYLIHPLGQFSTLRLSQFIQLDGSGFPISGGISAGVNDGTNNVLCIFNISSNRFFRAMARVCVHLHSGSNVPVTDNNTWRPLAPHTEITATFNYPNAYLSAYIRAMITNTGSDPSDYNMDFGLFVDDAQYPVGTPIVWNVRGAKDNTVNVAITGLTLGSHKVEIRCKKAAVVDQSLAINESHTALFSLP